MNQTPLELSAHAITQIAVAVFLGNMMTVGVVKGYQRMKKEDRFEWVTAVYYLGPLIGTASVLWIAR